MKVFISWSGERSEALAKALREWFPLVLYFIDPWLSKSDIQAGDRWSIEIAKELEGCNFGVLCITRENLNSPWILFEAGALAKSMQEGRVIPLLLDLDFKDISGPLAQFQAKKADKSGIGDLISDLNKAATTSVPETRLETLFLDLWGRLESQINSIPKSSAPDKTTRPQSQILEELVSSVRNVEMRVRDAMDDDPIFRKRRRIRFNPDIAHMLMHHVTEGPYDPVQLLIFAGLLRDDVPWLYELALEAYRAIKSGQKEEAQKALRRFRDIMSLLQRSPILEELGVDRSFMKMFQSDLFGMSEFMDIYSADEITLGAKAAIRRVDKKKSEL